MEFAGLGKNVLQIKQSPPKKIDNKLTLHCLLHPQNARLSKDARLKNVDLLK